MNTSSPVKDDPKEKARQRFQRACQIGMNGCGREYCFCKYCANHPGAKPLKKEEAAAHALKIITNFEIPLCEDRIVPKSLQQDEINQFEAEAPTNETAKATMYKRVAEVFGSYESLNISFMRDSSFDFLIDESDSRIDHKLIEKFFNLINKIEPRGNPGKDPIIPVIRKCLENSVDTFLADYKRDMIYDCGQLRFLLIILDIPLIFEFDFHTILIGLLKICSFLPNRQTQVLINWLSKYTKEQMSRLVETLQNLISIQIVTTNEKPYIKNLLVLSKILYEANKISKVVSYEDFYIETITQEEDPKEEFAIWLANKKAGSTEFTYVDYPWVLEPAFKSYILQAESDEEMSNVIKEDLHGKMQGLAGGLLGGLLNPLMFMNDFYFHVKVRRENIVEDTLNQIVKAKANFKKPLKVKFHGEQGVDEGGVRKEFFQLLCRQLLTPDFGMFVAKNNNRYLWFNGHSFEMPINFELTGMLLGLAIYNSINLDLKFPLVVYKKLLNQPVGLEDLEALEPEMYKGLKHILTFEGNLESALCVNFQVTYEVFGESHAHNLVPNGDKIFINQNNKHEYIKLYVDWCLNKSIENQFNPFYKGFKKVVTGEFVKTFTAEELQTLICGSQHLDFRELERVAKYEEPYTKDTKVIKEFWEVVHELNEEQKKKFLMFLTGSDRAPVKGLGDMLFVISRHGPDSET